MKKITPFTCELLSISLIISCGNPAPVANAEEHSAPSPNTATSIPVSSSMSDNSRSALLELKEQFDAQLRKGFGDRSMAYVYEQHALRMKLDLLNNEPYDYLFPYNGKFSLADHLELVEEMPFLTYKCGFQKEDGEVIHYYCLGLEGGFIDHLTEVGENNELIKRFAARYQEVKTIDPQAKQDMVLNAQEELSFEELDHQLYYFLFHVCVNEERLAVKKLNEAG